MSARITRITLALVLAGSMAWAGCAGDDTEPIDTDTTDTLGMQEPMEETAEAQLQPTQGNNVSGTVTFTSLNGTVRIEADVSGLAPGAHGFHIHQNGDCSAPDASSAGDHFNPTNAQHGGPDAAQRHVGDLGNLEAGSDSTATYTRVDSLLALSGTNSVLNRAVVVHAGEDDLTSQPSGNAGDRVACGVIESGMGGMPGMAPGQSPMNAPGQSPAPGQAPAQDPGENPRPGESPNEQP